MPIIMHEIPENAVLDKALAEEMAYAEKPFQEDALAIRALKNRAREVQHTLPLTRVMINETENIGSNPQVLNHNRGVGLSIAHENSLRLATDASERARKSFHAQKTTTE